MLAHSRAPGVELRSAPRSASAIFGGATLGDSPSEPRPGRFVARTSVLATIANARSGVKRSTNIGLSSRSIFARMSGASVLPSTSQAANEVAKEVAEIESRAEQPPGADPGVHTRSHEAAQLSAERPGDRRGRRALIQLDGPQPPQPAGAQRFHKARSEQVAHGAAGARREGRRASQACRGSPGGRQRRSGHSDTGGAEHRG